MPPSALYDDDRDAAARAPRAVGLLNARRSITETAIPSAPRVDRPPHRAHHLADVAAPRARPLVRRAVVPARILDAVPRRDEERVRRRVVDEDETPARMRLQEAGPGAAPAAPAGRARLPRRRASGASAAGRTAHVSRGRPRTSQTVASDERRAPARRRSPPRSAGTSRTGRRAGRRARAASRARAGTPAGRFGACCACRIGEVLARRGDVAADRVDERVAQHPVARVRAGHEPAPSSRARGAW